MVGGVGEAKRGAFLRVSKGGIILVSWRGDDGGGGRNLHGWRHRRRDTRNRRRMERYLGFIFFVVSLFPPSFLPSFILSFILPTASFCVHLLDFEIP